jgi:hypothetical protein
MANPGLAFALASNRVFHRPAVKKPLRAARSQLRKKQREILSWLGFAPTESVRRILRKIDPSDLTVERLLYLRDGLSDPAVVKSLSHLPSVNSLVLRLATDPRLRGWFTPRWLAEVAADTGQVADPAGGWPRQTPFDLLMDTLRMLRLVGEGATIRPFSSSDHLRRTHDALVGRAGAPDWGQEWHGSRSALPDRFPAPPFPGTAKIVPLLTPEALQNEGAEMRHCVVSHSFEVADGDAYVYRVVSPVRATLSIGNVGGRWRPREMRGPGNVEIDPLVCARIFGELEWSAYGGEGEEEGAEHREHSEQWRPS